MTNKGKPMSSKGFPNLKKRLSTLVQETPFRGFAKKSITPTPNAQPQSVLKERPKGKNNVPAKVRESLLDDTVLGDFKPFDIDLSTLESFRLSENQIDVQCQDQSSSTPIADNFIRNSSQTERPPQSQHEQFESNPVTLPKFETRAESALLGRVSIDVKISRDETRNFQTQKPLNVQPQPDQHKEVEPSRTHVIQSQSTNPSEKTKIPTKHEVKAVSLLKPVDSSEHTTSRNLAQTIERLNSNKRHSMPPSIPSELANRRSVADIKDSLAHRSVSSPQERRLSLQPASPVAIPSASPSILALPSRTSTRLSDRLTWIRELEEGNNNSNNPGRDFVLKNVQGGVADKLAKFEGKQLNGSLTRTNSTISRISSVDAYGIESSHVSIKSRASTVDTSNRASSVFTNFDESFRGKMEMLAGAFADRTQEESAGREKSSSRVSSKFIPVTATGNSETTILSQEVIDSTTLCDGDQENVINDIVNHRNISRTLSSNGSNAIQQLNNAANSSLTELPLSYINKRPSSSEKKSKSAPIPIQVESPPRKPKPSNPNANVTSVPPAMPMRTAMDINSPPHDSVFDALRIEVIPLTKDEQRYPASPTKSEGGVEKVESHATPKFNPAALPLFVPA
jgi:hypothetical protein